MQRKWLVVPAFLTGLLLLATVDTQGQQPGGNGGGFGGKGKKGGKNGGQDGGFGGAKGFGGFGGAPGGFGGGAPGGVGGAGGGFRMDPGAMWDGMAQGKDSINLNDPSYSWMKGMMER